MHRQLLIAALTLTFSCGLTASAATLTFKYNTSDKTATITGWTGSEPTDELRIPLQSTNPDDGIKYKVTAVAPGVFNDLDKITSVYIRKNIMTIGGCTGNDRISYGVGLANFYNCPNIQFFEVEEGNQYFKNTGIGMLVSADGSILYRVPSDCDTDANGPPPRPYQPRRINHHYKIGRVQRQPHHLDPRHPKRRELHRG